MVLKECERLVCLNEWCEPHINARLSKGREYVIKRIPYSPRNEFTVKEDNGNWILLGMEELEYYFNIKEVIRDRKLKEIFR